VNLAPFDEVVQGEVGLPTLETGFNKLDEPLPLGYCNAGRIIEIGAGVKGLETAKMLDFR